MESQICAALAAIPGVTVIRLSGAGVPDLAVHYGARWYLAEVKSRGGKLTPRQTWADIVPVWRNSDDALETLGVVRRRDVS